jgi:hypothetical protein
MFGLPFGRPHDWNHTVIDICKEMRLKLVLANGGINKPGAEYYERIPIDGQNA